MKISLTRLAPVVVIAWQLLAGAALAQQPTAAASPPRKNWSS